LCSETKGEVLIYTLKNTFLPISHWGKLRPPGIGIEATAHSLLPIAAHHSATVDRLV